MKILSPRTFSPEPAEHFSDAELRAQASAPDPRMLHRALSPGLKASREHAARVRLARQTDLAVLIRRGYSRQDAVEALRSGRESFTAVAWTAPPHTPLPRS